MKKLYLTFLKIAVLIFCTLNLQAQNEIPDNKGKEFWVMFNRNYNNSGVNLSLFISGDSETSGMVELPDDSVIEFAVVPGAITTIEVPSSLIATASDGIEDKGIRVTAENEITVYGLNQAQFTTDAFLALPTDILEGDYLVMSYTTLNSSLTNTSLLGVVGTENGTTITIIPSSTAGSRTVGVAYTINLEEGQSYQLQAPGLGNDLTGTMITSNKPVAVFGGHTCANVPPGTAACDHMIEQMPPASSFGERFVTTPLATREAGDIFRVLASENGTNITVTGSTDFSQSFTLNSGEYEELDIPSDEYTQIEASNPVLVAQYSKGQNSDGNVSDPFMLLIPPFEQFQNRYTVTTPAEGFNRHFINLAVPSSQVGNVFVDSNPVDASEFTAIASTGFSGVQVEVEAGTHNLTGPLPFGAFMYGFGNFDSYGYPGGQALGQVAEVEEISLSIEPIIGQGDEYCFSATAVNDEGSPVSGIRIDFLVNGVNNAEGFAITDAEGMAEFCYTPENIGEDVITASVGNVSAQATISVEAPTPSSLTLEPESITVQEGVEVCITGIVLDQFGNPLAGIEVFTEVDGEPVGSGISDENGEVEYCFTPTESGNINIVCYYEGGDRVTAEVFVTPAGEAVNAFTLIDSQTGTDILEIQVGGSYAIEDLPDLLAIRVDLDAQNIGSVVFDLKGPFTFKKTETNAPYALFGNLGNDYEGRIFPPGDYMLSATPYSEAQGKGTPGIAFAVSFSIEIGAIPDDLSVLGFDLYDAVFDSKIMDIEEGSVIDLGTLDNNSLTVLAKTLPDFIGSLKIEMEGPLTTTRIENNRPYTLFANNSVNLFGRAFPNGSYRLMATPFTQANAQGTAGAPLEINFEVIGTPASDAMKVYPVPFTDYFFVDLPDKNQNLDVQLFDYLGQPVKVYATAEAGKLRVATSSLREGLYIMQIFSEEYPVKTLKVQKIR
ncbi:MAG TPA: T9SS type A sorting domain-containing protein [Leeuwenhoekiella sp.]|nr:T9SS type A sorting domain-containing protein [Leeuwenhoekiella sp.]